MTGDMLQESGDVLVTLYRENRLELIRLALLLVGDRETAEDIVQDVFARLHGRRPGVLTLAYVRSSVLNGARSALRRRRVALHKPPPALVPAESAEAAALLGETRQEVLTAVTRLPARQRETLVLRYYLDLSDAEIADVTGLRQSTVRSTVMRALHRLERELRASG
ncbi:sigma-70 family RNA polymerase sigma factor [Herbidospora daliensis]|uniref:sigma-70 family RNA polymerase sigma factor n=1 Tax=Herbidospora daliensis TaxID=295585 RepID=UPI001E6473C7|nr:sigma-70 family RNA polymerase sigma factor [Herbidospora daliensis]